MSSECKISDYSQTLSEPEEEEMEEEEEDNVQVMFSQIEPYHDEPSAEDGSTEMKSTNKQTKTVLHLLPIVLEARYEREIPVNSWFI